MFEHATNPPILPYLSFLLFPTLPFMKPILPLFLSVILWHPLASQNIAQLQQNPLLISPSFAGSDSLQRVCLATQHWRTSFTTSERYQEQQTQAYFASFDRKSASGKSAFAASINYWKYGLTDNQHWKDSTKGQQPGNYDQNRHLGAEKLELGFSYVPVFWKVSSKGSPSQLIPALCLQYARNSANEAQERMFNLKEINFGNYYYPAERQFSMSGKSGHWDRLALGGSLLFQNARFFASYQLMFRMDKVDMSYLYQSTDDYLIDDSTWQRQHANSAQGKPARWQASLGNTLAIGISFPKRSNSLLQFQPIFAFDYKIPTLNGMTGLPISGDYYLRPTYYTYTESDGFNIRNASFNLRIWKIVTGVNYGQNSNWTLQAYYYVGFKTSRLALTAGMATLEIFNTSLQIRL